MRFNSKGAPIYESGDVVLLTDKRPGNWESGGAMDHYLNTIVTINAIAYDSGFETSERPNGRFNFPGSSGWSFQVRDIASIANPELIQEFKERQERRLQEFREKFKTFVTKGEDVYAIAKDIFGEEHTSLDIISPTEFEIIVLFPEIHMTNSRRHRHTIKDLYVKIHVDINVNDTNIGDRVSTISFYGRRGKVSEEEYHSAYGHSHFGGDGLQRWSDFCLGSGSDFSMIVQSMVFSLTPEDWSLLFLSLENYVSWESLEGGPYKNMSNIALRRQQTYNSRDFRNHALELIKTLPNACLTLNDGKVQINADHPALAEHYASKSRIKSFTPQGARSFASTQASFNSFVQNECRPFDFKGERIRPTLYSNAKDGEVEDKTQIDRNVIDFYNSTINKELKQYNISYEYNKISASSTLFREASPF